MSWWGIGLLVVGGLLLLSAVGGYLGFHFMAVDTSTEPPGAKLLERTAYRHFVPRLLAGQDWLRAQPQEQVSITSYDGLRLVGHLLKQEQSRGVMILFHGFRSSYLTDFSCIASFYASLGLSLLLVEQRGQQASSGRYMTYGVRERHDVVSWVTYVNQRLGSDTPIFLGGISMGASTVLMACGLSLPENVRGVMADCGFTSPYEEIKYVLNQRLHLPDFPLLPLVGLFCRLFAGFGLREASTVTAQRSNTIPTFFVHGRKDRFVPPYMTEQSYAACSSTDKELLLAPEATHGVSYLAMPEQYEQAVKTFIDRQLRRK